jgi:hypothetical protein
MKKLVIILLSVVLLSVIACSVQQDRRTEASSHPRIENAIIELENAIDLMEKAPNDFGGYKAQAIADSKRAVESLKLALQYRSNVDNSRRK